MKNSTKQSHLIAWTLLLSAPFFIQPAMAQQWKAVIIPASLNANNTIRLLGGQTQVISLVLQADKAITQRGETQQIEMELNYPSGFKFLGNTGRYQFTEQASQARGNRTVTNYQVQATNKSIAGAPGTRILGEGNNQTLVVAVPSSIAPGEEYLLVKLKIGDKAQEFKWPLEIRNFTPVAQRARRTTIGLWDYTYARATTPQTSEGIAKMLKDSGINFVQKAENPVYRNAMKAQEILTGGYTHHSAFGHGFANPQAIIELPQDAKIPGVKQLIDNAHQNNNIAVFDYEPRGTGGFNPKDVAVFKEKYNVSDNDFQRFQEYVAKYALKTFEATDPFIQKTWRQWTAFRSHQASQYVRLIYESVKQSDPQVQLVMTSSRPYGDNSPGTLAWGANNAAMSPYVDVVMPQLYAGYGANQVKWVMQATQGWRQEIKDRNAQTALWPLLVVRYSGATPSNSPTRLRQQTIGSIAHGAQGILYYYPVNMDAPYWEMVAQVNNELARYEDFYHLGQRVEKQFKLSGLPISVSQMEMSPGYKETIHNAGWAFTAHEHQNKVLLTLFNLEEANDLIFGIEIGNRKLLTSENVTQTGNGNWLVSPGEIGFITLEK